jgi:hypothetical protein
VPLGRKALHIEKFHDLYSAQNHISDYEIKEDEMASNVTSITELRQTREFQSENVRRILPRPRSRWEQS